jgi:hypothetical protein
MGLAMCMNINGDIVPCHPIGDGPGGDNGGFVAIYIEGYYQIVGPVEYGATITVIWVDPTWVYLYMDRTGNIINPPAAISPPAANNGKLTPAQCQAAQTLLNREAQSGTTVAAWQSAIGFGDGTVQPFNSSDPGNAYANTALGAVKVDWFTDLRTASLIPGPQVPAYIVGKLTWTGVRLATGAPITNYLPFQDPVESRTMALAVSGVGFRGLFTPAFMKANCGGK